MRQDLYRESFDQEKYYWWHVAKHKLVIFLIKKFAKDSNLKILDLGCGTGMLAKKLEKMGKVYGLDNSTEAVKLAQKRGLKKILRYNLEVTPFPFKKNQFNIILALDVFEHLQFPEKTLFEIKRILKPNGLLICTVPSYQFLWSYWDQMLDHFRRYTKDSFVFFLKSKKFKPLFSSYFHTFIFLPSIIIRFTKQAKYKLKKRTYQKLSSDFIHLPKFLNNLLLLISNIELKLIKYSSLPFGLSIVIVCQNLKNES
jgi:2-polyprenyl-3-methyl-5-hydroxy-6-metoxy-1,4-benzoquinol methylase